MADRHIQLVAFDLGNVLVRILKKHAPQYFFETNRHLAFNTGKIDSSTFFGEISMAQKIRVSQLKIQFSSMIEPYEFTRALLRDLKIPFTLWSNINVHHFHQIIKRCPELYQLKYSPALSFLLGCQKPLPQFFARALQLSGITPASILYLDDKIENIKAAKRFGISSQLVTNDRNAYRILQGYSLLNSRRK